MSSPIQYNTDRLILMACQSIDERGYISKARAQKEEIESTFDHAIGLYNSDFNTEVEEVTNGVREICAKVLEWSFTLQHLEKELCEYEKKVSELCWSPTVGIDDAHYVISAPAAYANYTRSEKAEKKEAPQEKAASGQTSDSSHVGRQDQRLTMEVTITQKKRYEGPLGKGLSFLFTDAQSNQFGWLTFFPTPAEDWKEGETCTIAGTVKGHRTTDGVKITVLSRVRRK